MPYVSLMPTNPIKRTQTLSELQIPIKVVLTPRLELQDS